MRSQLLVARLALAALVLAALAAAGAVAGVRLALLTYDAGLGIMTVATLLGLAAFLLALVWTLRALGRNDGAGKKWGLAALAGSLLFLYVPLSHAARAWSSPAINDVASDPDDPPRFVALARRRGPGMNSPIPDPGKQVHYKGETNTAAYMLHTYYGQFSTTPVTKPYAKLLKTPPQMFWHAFETAKKLGWTVIAYSQAEGRIEATQTSFWFGQVTDIAIRVQKAGTLGARVDVRAQSERGSRDFGHNLMLASSFFQAFKGGGF
jgi:hypothetical protein